MGRHMPTTKLAYLSMATQQGKPLYFAAVVSLLHQRRSTEVNQTLHDVQLSPELVHYIHTFLGLLPSVIHVNGN